MKSVGRDSFVGVMKLSVCRAGDDCNCLRCRLPLPDNLIVTPFAQILHSLRTVRNNYIAFTSLSPDHQLPSQSVSASADLRYDTIYDLHWNTDRQAASLIWHMN